MSVLTLHKAHR